LSKELATALSAAVPNQQSATIAVNLAQTAGLCKDNELRENAVRLLAERGDAKAERILGNLYSFGGSTIARDRAEGMAWYDRAGAHGDLFAQRFHREFSEQRFHRQPPDKVSHPDLPWMTQENFEMGLWVERNCPGLC
jgi:hypothetical protein